MKDNTTMHRPQRTTRTKSNLREAIAATAEELAVQTMERVTGRGLDSQERELSRLEQISNDLKEPFYLLSYDIADNSGCPNPSGRLWHLGFRKQLSVWGITHRGLMDPRMQALATEWNEYGITWDIIRQHDDERAKFYSWARHKLEEHVRELHTSLIDRLDGAAKRYDKAKAALEELVAKGEVPNAREWERLIERREDNVRGALKDASDALAAAIECAQRFDDTEDTQQLLKAYRHAVRSAALSHNKEMDAKKAKHWKYAPVPE